MKKFEVLVIVKNADAITEQLGSLDNINLYYADGEEPAIEKMQEKHIDIIIYEGGRNFALRNKLRSLQTIFLPRAQIIEYDERNIHALADDLEMAMEKINAGYDGAAKFYDDPSIL